MSASIPTSTHTRLLGGRLLLTQAVWLCIMLTSVVLIVVSLPLEFGIRVRSLSDEQVLFLQQIGLGREAYGAYRVGLLAAVEAVFVACALLIFWRKSDDWTATLVSIMLITFGVNSVPALPEALSEQPYLIFPMRVLQICALGSLAAFPYIFPSTRSRFRWANVMVLVWAVWALVWPLAYPQFSFDEQLLFLVALVTATHLYRYVRMSDPIQRQQTKWVVLGFTFMFIGNFFMIFILYIVPSLRYGLGQLFLRVVLSPVFLVLPLALIPLSITASIWRYRLWDIDFIINRSLVYGAATLILGAVFMLGFLILQTVFQALTGGQQPIPVAVASTAIVVALFNPTRQRLRQFVDRRVYGIQIAYTPTRAVERPREAQSESHFGIYTQLKLVGHGGMAEVYQATHPTLKDPVAIKVLSAKQATDPDLRRRFNREAQLVARLQHPNIVRLHDYGEDAGALYMVMEFITGQDLAQFMQVNGRASLPQALPIITQIASALDYAHLQGIVHRDIKPSNVMLAPLTLDTYRVVLLDFGIAKILNAHTALTKTEIMGTFDYIAPEQIQATADVDGRADVYSLGVLVYQLLTGELPFKQQNISALLIAHLTQPPGDARLIVPELPRATAHALQRALAKGLDERFATAGEFIAALSLPE